MARIRVIGVDGTQYLHHLVMVISEGIQGVSSTGLRLNGYVAVSRNDDVVMIDLEKALYQRMRNLEAVVIRAEAFENSIGFLMVVVARIHARASDRQEQDEAV